jgi:hypothetical protein
MLIATLIKRAPHPVAFMRTRRKIAARRGDDTLDVVAALCGSAHILHCDPLSRAIEARPAAGP